MTAHKRMVSTGGSDVRDAIRTAIIVETLINAIQMPTVWEETPENFGYMSGAVKDFFDRTFYPAEGKVFRKPYVVFISAGNDGTGALSSIERISLGYQFKKVYDPVIARQSQGGVTDEILARCRELGQTIAGGLEAGIY